MLQIVKIEVNGVREDFEVVSEVGECRVLRRQYQVVAETLEIEPKCDPVQSVVALNVRHPSDFAEMPGRVASGRMIGLRKQSQIDCGYEVNREHRLVVSIESAERRGKRFSGNYRGKHCCWKETRMSQYRG